MEIKKKDVIKDLPNILNGSIDLIICDPPYHEDFTKYLPNFKEKLKPNGQILWCVQPTELFDLPEKPLQILVWKEPMAPKPKRRKYYETFDVIAWYAYGEYTFNNLLWNLMGSVFEDVIVAYERRHKWEKPATLIERLILVHTNKGDTILDPFAGSGIVGEIAEKFGRKYIGYDIEEKI